MDKKRIITLTIALVFAAFGIYGLFRVNSLKQKLDASEGAVAKMTVKVSKYQALMHIDSLLASGEYQSALEAYNTHLNDKDLQDISGVQLRMNIAERLMKLEANRSPRQDSIILKDSLDSIQATRLTGFSQEIMQYDSLSFALEKTKVQLANVRRQLQKKSFGEYLTFTNKKGSLMHYVGEVKNKMANGYGIALLNTGSRYEGEWKDNQRHGHGSFYWADGEHYIGDYINDLRNGEGTYHWPNGEKYVGHWKDDKRNGFGVFYGADGDIVTQGTWEDDKLVKEDK